LYKLLYLGGGLLIAALVTPAMALRRKLGLRLMATDYFLNMK
jgi:hypothetical protein